MCCFGQGSQSTHIHLIGRRIGETHNTLLTMINQTHFSKKRSHKRNVGEFDRGLGIRPPMERANRSAHNIAVCMLWLLKQATRNKMNVNVQRVLLVSARGCRMGLITSNAFLAWVCCRLCGGRNTLKSKASRYLNEWNLNSIKNLQLGYSTRHAMECHKPICLASE